LTWPAGLSAELAEHLRWQRFDGGAMPLRLNLALSETGSSEPDSTDAHLDVRWPLDLPIRSLIVPLAQLYRSEFGLPERLLWGNVASGVAGAARGIGIAEPRLAAVAIRLADAQLRHGELAGTADLPSISLDSPAASSTSLSTSWQIRRRSCCLFYRVPGAGTCGDCVLLRRHRPV
jgi:hypothetical protein